MLFNSVSQSSFFIVYYNSSSFFYVFVFGFSHCKSFIQCYNMVKNKHNKITMLNIYVIHLGEKKEYKAIDI